MSAVRQHSSTGVAPRVRRGAATLALALLSAIAVAGCDTAPDGNSSRTADGAGSATVAPVTVSTNIDAAAESVAVDKVLRVRAEGGRLTSVTVSSSAGPLAGRLAPDGTDWVAEDRLEPGLDYVVRSVAESSTGRTRTTRQRFHTADLSLDQQTYASISPLDGETVGVGMPVVLTFDVPVTDRASIEKHLSVTSSPRQVGAWHWLSDQEVHWRPREYWRAGTDVSVDVDINSVSAGDGIYGQESRSIDFEVGDAVVSKVDAQTHQMRTYINGELVRTTPITTGKPGFTTRSGIKVIMEKFRTRRMNSETVGIAAGSAEAYDIDDVEYAMRVTHSGEFLHAAPWSVGSQGSANVSHGCTGMSTADAGWLYNVSKRGDVVEYTGTDRPMTLENGYGDWNASFADYRAGSAL